MNALGGPGLIVVALLVLVLFWGGKVARLGGELGLAIREFNRGLLADRDAPFADEALYWKGQAFEGLKQIDKAAECYSKLLKDYPASKLVAKVKEKIK